MKCCGGDGARHYVDLMFGIFQWLLSVLLILSSFIVFYVSVSILFSCTFPPHPSCRLISRPCPLTCVPPPEPRPLVGSVCI